MNTFLYDAHVDDSAFLKRLALMRAHFEKHGGAAGPYWSPLVRLVSLQTRLSKGQLYSADSFYAGSFAGTPQNGSAVVAKRWAASKRRWLVDRMQNLLLRLGLDRTAGPLWRLLFSQKITAYHASQADATYKTLTRCAYRLMQDDIERLNVRSPDVYGPDIVEVAPGRKLASRTIWELDKLLRLRKVISSDAKVFLEIGAGCGELARLALATKTARQYIIVDIPPALAYSERLLSESLPQARISLFDPARKAVDLSDGCACYFLTPDQLPLVPAFDAGFNIASFGEMTPAIVSGYVKALKCTSFGEFISINLERPPAFYPEGADENLYRSLFAPEYQLRAKTPFPLESQILGQMMSDESAFADGYQLLHFVKSKVKVTA